MATAMSHENPDPTEFPWKAFVRVRGEASFNTNGLRFDTKEAAEEYARDLSWRWTLVEEWEVRKVA